MPPLRKNCSNNVSLFRCSVIAACLSRKSGQVDPLGYKQGHKGSTLLPKPQNRGLIPSTEVFTWVENSVESEAPFEDPPARDAGRSSIRNV